MNDYIQGDMFERVAYFNFSPMIKIPSDYSRLQNTFYESKLKGINIVYTHTFYVKQLFAVIEKIKKKFIIVTHNSDDNIDFLPPENVIHWFAQNVSIKNERIESIPIGLENSRWFVNLDKIGKMKRKLQRKKDFKNMIYVNHDVRTNPAKREKPYKVLMDEKWATIGTGANGQGFDNYLENIYNHPFVVCPEGNGIDTHRVWECLYMNTIPVQLRNINNQFYTDLPILFLDDWEELSEKFLYDNYMKFTETKWNSNKLNFTYWENRIKSYVEPGC